MTEFEERMKRSFMDRNVEELLDLERRRKITLAPKLESQTKAVFGEIYSSALARWQKFTDGRILALINGARPSEIAGDVVSLNLNHDSYCVGESELGIFYVVKSVSDCHKIDNIFSRQINLITGLYRGFVIEEFDQNRYTHSVHDWLCIRARRWKDSKILDAYVSVDPRAIESYEVLQKNIYLDEIDKKRITNITNRNPSAIW